jgi:WD40 repeat protein
VTISLDGRQRAVATSFLDIDILGGLKLRRVHARTHIFNLAFSPDGQRIASDSDDETIKIWDVLAEQEIRTLTGHTGRVTSVAYSPDGRQIASGSLDSTIKIWDASTGKEIRTLEGHTHVVRNVAFSPDGRRIASGSRDKTIKIWDVSQ